MKSNYHTHTSRCLHAQGTERDYVTAAVRSHLDILGFSDHAPFPDHDFGLRMPYSELDSYLETLDSLTKDFSADIILLKSLEIEYLPEYSSYYEELLTEKHLDYLLLGEHFFHTAHGEIQNITSAPGTECYLDYARAVSAALSSGYFRIVAHPDIYMMNPFAWDKNCDIAADMIISAADRSGAILEYNANGFRRGIQEYPDGSRYMYPHIKFWSKAAEAGIPVVIGSDCHNPSQVWDEAMERAYIELDKIGIRPLLQIDDITRPKQQGESSVYEHTRYCKAGERYSRHCLQGIK